MRASDFHHSLGNFHESLSKEVKSEHAVVETIQFFQAKALYLHSIPCSRAKAAAPTGSLVGQF